MRKLFPIGAILILAAFLRFYRLPDLFIFSGDEEYQATLAQTILSNFHIIWVGVTAGQFGFYLGPLWTYITAFFLFISRGDPLITGYVSSMIGVFTTGLIMYVGNKLFGRLVSLIAGLLYATLPLIVYFDQKYWNPSLVPAISLGMLFSLSQVKTNSKWWLVFFLLLGLTFHVHLSLIPYALIALFLFFKKKFRFLSKNIILGIVIFLITYSPLIAFDYFHKGSNITTPLRFKEFSSAPSVQINPKRHFDVLFQTLGRIWYINPNSSNADNVLYACSPFAYLDKTSELVNKVSTRTTPFFGLSFLSLLLIIWFIIYSFKVNSFNQKLLASAILLISLSFLILPVATHEYYLLGIFPLILFLPGIFIKELRFWKMFAKMIILLISVLGIITILSTKDDFGIKHKQELVNKVLNKVGNSSVEIDQAGICQHYGGWRYLFKLEGKLPTKSVTDDSLGWLYPEEISNKKADYKIIFHESRVPLDKNIEKAKTFSEGGFNVYIIKK